jgi:hypothetical protein
MSISSHLHVIRVTYMESIKRYNEGKKDEDKGGDDDDR